MRAEAEDAKQNLVRFREEIRALFEAYGLTLQEWDKACTDRGLIFMAWRISRCASSNRPR